MFEPPYLMDDRHLADIRRRTRGWIHLDARPKVDADVLTEGAGRWAIRAMRFITSEGVGETVHFPASPPSQAILSMCSTRPT